MRTRYLRYEFFLDEDIKDLPYEARLFYQGLWCVSDKEGRGEDRPARLKIVIMPYDKIDAEKIMDILAQPKSTGRPFIIRYIIDNEHYYQIVNWHKHQKPHQTEADSKIPPHPPNLKITDTITIKDTIRQETEKSVSATNIQREGNVNTTLKPEITELKGLKLYETDKKLIDQWDELLPAWQIAYPGVDIPAEIKKAHVWELSNPKKRKIDRPRFLSAWLARCQDKPQGGYNAAGKSKPEPGAVAYDASKYDKFEGK